MMLWSRALDRVTVLNIEPGSNKSVIARFLRDATGLAEMAVLGTTLADVAVWGVAVLLLIATIWSIRQSKKPAEAVDVEVASISAD